MLGPNYEPDGQWSLPIVAPSIDVIDGQYAVMQAFVLDAASGRIVLSDTSNPILVDEAF